MASNFAGVDRVATGWAFAAASSALCDVDRADVTSFSAAGFAGVDRATTGWASAAASSDLNDADRADVTSFSAAGFAGVDRVATGELNDVTSSAAGFAVWIVLQQAGHPLMHRRT